MVPRRKRRMTSCSHGLLISCVVFAAAALSSCATTAPQLPRGSGTPFVGFMAAYEQATANCGGVKTITASMGLAGKVGSTRLRGRIERGPGHLAPDTAA